ncbi:unnamed protein product, partial [marine sediment metagenome]
DKIRLGTVTGDVAARLGASLRVTGVSIKDFTKEAVEQHLLRTTSRDVTGRTASQDTAQDTIRIVKDPEYSIGSCPTCGTPCLTCGEELMPVSEFKTIVSEAVNKGLDARQD